MARSPTQVPILDYRAETRRDWAALFWRICRWCTTIAAIAAFAMLGFHVLRQTLAMRDEQALLREAPPAGMEVLRFSQTNFNESQSPFKSTNTTDLRDRVISQNLQVGRPPAASILLAPMRAPSGRQAIVAVQGYRSLFSSIGTTTVLQVEALVVEQTTLRSTRKVYAGSTANRMWNLPDAIPPSNMMVIVHAGLVNPADPSHATFTVTYDGQPRIYDVWLRDGGILGRNFHVVIEERKE